MDRGESIATHTRCYDKGQQIENPTHIEALKQHKRAARKHGGMDRLSHAVPGSVELLQKAAERGDNIGSIVADLLRLLDDYGATELEIALHESLASGVAHPSGVRTVLERRREQRDQPPPISIDLRQHPQAQEVSVKPHDLASYDQLSEQERES